jgi:peptide/nickel transport system substrate-binding protein
VNRKLLVLPAMVGLIAPALAGCGGSYGGSGGPIVVGTTDQIQASPGHQGPLDPAAANDSGAQDVLRNTFQTLLSVERSGTDPVPDAASSCSFADAEAQDYLCTLRSGLKFSNGDPLTAEDVKFSIDRSLRMQSLGGPSSLLDDVASVAVPDNSTVEFHLKSPDATFPYRLATPAAAIVDSKVYPAGKVRNGYRIIGSGPYTLDSFIPGDSAVFSKNPYYKGAYTLNNSKIELKFFKSSDAMESALKSGSIDVMNRMMTPTQIAGLRDSTATSGQQNIELTGVCGTEIRYVVFNTDDPSVKNVAVRKAVAQVVDRQALVRDVYADTAQPLYSMVPQGITGHTNSFFDLYGDPNPSAARATLQNAGISTPVALTLSYTTDHYGSVTAQEFAELKKQLEASGLFTVTLQGVPWQQYRPDAKQGKYAVYGMSWSPDFPDPDDYIAPFFGTNNFLGSSYTNSDIESNLIPRTRQQAERSSAVSSFEQAQGDIAQDVPFLPLWQGQQYLAAKSDITGTEWAFNASSELQYWELGRGVTN